MVQVRVLLLYELNEEVLVADRLFVLAWDVLMIRIRLKVNKS